MHIFCNITRPPGRDYSEEITRMFSVGDFVKTRQFSIYLVLHTVFHLKSFWLLLLLEDKHYTVAVLVFNEMVCYNLRDI